MSRHSPFSQGSQAFAWDQRNCYRCKHFPNGQKDDDFQPETCDIRIGIDEAWCNDDNCVPEDIAKRMGLLDNEMCYTWDCPEKEKDDG